MEPGDDAVARTQPPSGLLTRAVAALKNVFRAGRGRPAAVATLAAFACALPFPQYTPLGDGQTALFDTYQRAVHLYHRYLAPRQREAAPVTIVEIDEASLKQIGQWPWPRNRTAELIDAIAAMAPLAIGLDMYMPERDMTSPEAVAANLPPDEEKLGAALRQMPSHDARFAAALANNPTVLGAAGFDFETLTTSSGLRVRPLRVEGGDALPWLRSYPFVLASLPELQAAAHGQALLSVDLEDGIVRRLPLVATVNGQVVPSLAMEMLRMATDSDAVEVKVGIGGIESVSVGDLVVPTQNDGTIWLHFVGATRDRYVSAADVLAGRADPQMFENKLVLLGLTGMGLSDMRTTAIREQVPGIDIQAQALERLFEGRLLLRPAWMVGVEIALLFASGLFLIWAMPNLKPSVATGLTTFLSAALFGAGFVLFVTTGLLLDAATVLAGLNTVFGSLLSTVFIEADQQRRETEATLNRERESAARISGELEAARRIQMGSLPDAAAAFPNETRFEVAALLEPAREVGGDLYDFFMLDERRLFFVVGDVSGKGVPASLFMAVAKALAKSAAMRGAADIGTIVETANKELARENPESLFVTAVAGILDADSGAVELVNAGQTVPWRIGVEGAQKLAADAGPSLCLAENFSYPVVRFALVPGESLCFVTDGVIEATNEAGELYGNARPASVLAAAEKTAPALLGALREDVRDFVGAAGPADDLTLLVVRWLGAKA